MSCIDFGRWGCLGSRATGAPRGLKPRSRDVAKKLVLTRNLLAIRILKTGRLEFQGQSLRRDLNRNAIAEGMLHPLTLLPGSWFSLQ